MNTDRYLALVRDEDLPLTLGEQRRGWHFCPEFDGLLINPMDMPCECKLPDKARRRVSSRWFRYYTRKRMINLRRRGYLFFGLVLNSWKF